MATIIDSLIVTLGLDGAQFKAGVQEAEREQDDLTKNTKKNTGDREKVNRQIADAQKKRAGEEVSQNKKAVEAQKKTNDGYKEMRKNVLALVSVFTAGIGIKNFFASTINDAAALGFLSDNLKISTERLSAWQKASERAGGSAGGIVAQLKESADTLAQLKSGLGPNEGLQWFFRLGGSSSDLKDGNSYLLARSKIIHDLFKVDPTNAALMAKQMGVAEDQFNLLKQGPDAVMALVQAQEKNSAVTRTAADDALKLQNSWLDFTQSIGATARTLVLTLAPAITTVMQQFAKWADKVGENKDGIRQLGDNVEKFLTQTNWSAIIEGAQKFGAAVGVIADGIRDLSTNLKGLLDRWDEFTGKPKVQTPGVTKLPGAIRFGKSEDMAKDDAATGKKTPQRAPLTGWQKDVSDGIEMALARTMASLGHQASKEFVRDKLGVDLYNAGPKKPVPLIPPPAMQKAAVAVGNGNPPPPPPKPGAPKSPPIPPKESRYAIEKLKGMGWSEAQAAGMVASLIQESDLNPASRNPQSDMYGIAQWDTSRRGDFKAWAGKDIKGSSLDEQLAFMHHELTKGKEQAAGALLRMAKTAEEAARIHSEKYERPSDTGLYAANVPRRQLIAGELIKQQRTANANAAMSLPSGAAAAAPVTHMISNTNAPTTTNTTEVKIAAVNIQTAATDARGIAQEIKPALRFSFAGQANTGMTP